MADSSKTETPESPSSPHAITWIAAGLIGIGLWILACDTTRISAGLLILAAILVCVGGFLLFLDALKGKKSESPAIRTFFPLVASVGIAVVLLLGEHSIRYLMFPYPLDDGEGFCLNQAALIASGKSLYPPINDLPWLVTNYPPVFPFLLSIFVDPENIRLVPGRFLSTIATIVMCIATAGCVKAVTGDRRAAWIAALTVASSSVVFFWGSLVRIDILATALGMVGLWIASANRGWWKFWALPFVLAALFTRQSSVEVALAIAVGLFLTNKDQKEPGAGSRIKAIVFLMIWAAGIALIVLALQIWSHGEFWNHAVAYTRTRFFLERLVSNAQWIFQTHSLMLILAIIALPAAFADNRRRTIAAFFLASIGTAMLSGKVGSDLNYFLNLIAASGCLIGCFAADVIAAAKRTESRPAWVVPALILIPAMLFQSGLLTGFRALSFTPTGDDYSRGKMIVEILESTPGPILCEDEGFCLLSDHEVFFNPFIMSELAREGTWDQTPFVNSIRNKEFGIIMLRFNVYLDDHDDKPGVGGYAGWDRFTPEMEAAIRENYEPDRAVGRIYMRRDWHFYRPRSVDPDYPEGINETRNLLDSGNRQTQ